MEGVDGGGSAEFGVEPMNGAHTAASAADVHRCAQFLFEEAALLDRGDYRAWFELLTKDVVYWVPLLDKYANPEDELNLVYDNHGKLADRFGRLDGGSAFAQDPPSRTTRLVSNVQAWPTAEGFTTESAFILNELRMGITGVETFSGRYRHELVAQGETFAIRRKVIELVNRMESFSNLTFVL